MKRALCFAILILLFFLTLCATAPILAVHLIACLIASCTDTKWTNYGLQVFIAWDQLLNVLLAPVLRYIFKYPVFDFGYADETISSVIGKNILRAPEFTDESVFIVNKWLTLLDPKSKNHGVDSIEDDEGEI